MNYWRMAFRIGDRGYEMWPACQERGIAAIGYYTDTGAVVEDCALLTVEEYDEIWRIKDPQNTTGRSSLRNLAYKMEIGDVIYVKQGRDIVGRGRVISSYQYDPNILRGAEAEWEHFVRVDWETDFTPIEILLGAEQTTVLRLEGERLQRLENALVETIVERDIDSLNEEETYREGNRGQRYTNYYERNARLRAAAIRIHGVKCKICGFDFEAVYGARGAGYIEVHHLRPVSSFGEEIQVSPERDMIVVCSNCHRMIHRKQDEVLSPEEMTRILQR